MQNNKTWPPAPRGDAAGQFELVVYPSRWKMALVVLGGLMFVLCAPLVWNAGGIFLRTLAVADVLFFGLCTLYALSRFLRPRPSLIVDDAGLTDNASGLGAGRLSWDEVEGVGIVTFMEKRFLVIFPWDPDAVIARQPAYKRVAMRANLGMIGSPVIIPGHTTMPLEEMLAQVQTRLAASQTQPE